MFFSAIFIPIVSLNTTQSNATVPFGLFQVQIWNLHKSISNLLSPLTWVEGRIDNSNKETHSVSFSIDFYWNTVCGIFSEHQDYNSFLAATFLNSENFTDVFKMFDIISCLGISSWQIKLNVVYRQIYTFFQLPTLSDFIPVNTYGWHLRDVIPLHDVITLPWRHTLSTTS